MFSQVESIKVNLPKWLEVFGQRYVASLKVEDRMQFVIEAAMKNIEMQTGGPFAAAVFELGSGKLISLGVNLVTTQGLSILHAEILAISLAQRKLNTYDLDTSEEHAYELVTSTEPCAMCLGSIPWSGIRQVVTGASDQDARDIGFDEGPKPEDWVKALTTRGIYVVSHKLQSRARAVLKSYLKSKGEIYNSREASFESLPINKSE